MYIKIMLKNFNIYTNNIKFKFLLHKIQFMECPPEKLGI
jgi:hypothetical protein